MLAALVANGSSMLRGTLPSAAWCSTQSTPSQARRQSASSRMSPSLKVKRAHCAAVTKLVNELYAEVFARNYGFASIGLRYFNVFGPRQDPEGAYAAVIPKWIASMLRNEPVFINGDGETSRDFCFIDNVVQANLLAATTNNADATNQIYNVAVGDRTTLNELYELLRSSLAPRFTHLEGAAPVRRGFREGDVLHSLADIGKARARLGYAPAYRVREGMALCMAWYVASAGHSTSP